MSMLASWKLAVPEGLSSLRGISVACAGFADVSLALRGITSAYARFTHGPRKWWARQDLNLQPNRYERFALTRLSYGPGQGSEDSYQGSGIKSDETCTKF